MRFVLAKVERTYFRMKKRLILSILGLFLVSCSEYQKAFKSEDTEVKKAVAKKMYDKQKYNKAIRLYEIIAPIYKGKSGEEEMSYSFGMSYYNTKQYYLAAYQLEGFASSYPRDPRAEEAFFLSAKCFAELSPTYSLDQTETDKAIFKMQEFIDRYPNSTYMPQANAIAKDLRVKLERKAFEVAKQYNTIGDHKAAQVAFDIFLSDFPGTVFKEEALFLKLDSAFQLAVNSVPSKMQERLNNAKGAYQSLVKFKGDSKFKSKADVMLEQIDKELQQFSKS